MPQCSGYQGTVAPVEVRSAREIHRVNAPALHNAIGRGIADDCLVTWLAAAVVGIVISHVKDSRIGRQAGLVVADDLRLTKTIGCVSVQTKQISNFVGQWGVMGTADGVGSDASFYAPTGIAADGRGNLFVVNNFGCTVRKSRLRLRPFRL